MSSLAHEMGRLRDEIDSLRGARKVFIRDMKAAAGETKNQARTMVRDFRNGRAKRAGAEKEVRTAFVSALRTNVGEMVKGFHDDRSEMAEKLGVKLLNCLANLKQSIGELISVDDMLKAFESDRTEKAGATKTRLNQFVSELQADVAEMLGRFESDRADMAKETSAELLGCRSTTKRFAADLKDNVVAMQAGFSETRTERARADKEERERFADDLAQDVSRFKEGIRALRQKLAVDFRDARDAWRGVVPAELVIPETPPPSRKEAPEPSMEEKEVKGAEAQGRPAVAFEAPAAEVEEAPREEEITPDDLTRIKGIGVGRETRLNEAGIYTFAGLAESTPETLRNALGGMERMTNVEDWIKAAKRLAGKSR